MKIRSCLSKRLKELANSRALTGPSVKLKGLSGRELLLALGKDSRAVVRRVVAECAQWGTRRNVNLLLRLASDEDSEVRCTAIGSLGNLLEGEKKCPPTLLERLHDREMLVRAEAASVLGQIGDKKALIYLWPALRDPSPLVRSYVASAIGQVGESAHLALLKEMARKEKSSSAKIGFLDAAFYLGDKSFAMGGLIRLLGSKNYKVRCASANTLGSFQLSHIEGLYVLHALQRTLKKEHTPAAKEAILRSIRKLQLARHK